jgi:hypothetical protein
VLITAGPTYEAIDPVRFIGNHSTGKMGFALAEQLANALPVITVTDKKLTWSVANDQLRFPLVHLHDSVYRSQTQFNLNLDATLRNGYTSRNVLGWLKAKKKTSQTLIISAHYDHLGRMGQATYFPGGNDNASGTTMLVSLAKYFKEHKPDVNILFVEFAGEEAGLVGSNYFVEHPLLPLNTIQFVLYLDIMGSGEEGITVVNATLHPEKFATLNQPIRSPAIAKIPYSDLVRNFNT